MHITNINKSWESSVSITNKYLSRLLMYELSCKLDYKKFEVVFEGSIDIFNLSDEADIVIYSKENGFHPILGIEICMYENLNATKEFVKWLFKNYSINEFFILDISQYELHYLQNENNRSQSKNISSVVKPLLENFQIPQSIKRQL